MYSLAKRIVAMVIIFAGATVGWVILGATTTLRSEVQDSKLRASVGELWGTVQRQAAPELFTERTVSKIIETGDPLRPQMTQTETLRNHHPLESNNIDVVFNLQHRRKGLLWYPTYRIFFSAEYLVANRSDEAQEYQFEYSFPIKGGVFDEFQIRIDGDSLRDLDLNSGRIRRSLTLQPDEESRIEISYNSQGMSEWWYTFGDDVSQLRNFTLTMHTDFSDINFPDNAISPTSMVETEGGWELNWSYGNLISGMQIGLEMPQRLNPGPFVSRVTFFAPVSLFFFFFVMFIITTVKKIEIHPMNYFFIAAAFFAFHLLLAYLADHIDIHLATAISSLVSIFLVVSYMRLVIGLRFALVETGLSQFVFLVGFSYAFFLEGFTGLTITVCAILTLFVTMQYTARFDWTNEGAGTANPGHPASP